MSNDIRYLIRSGFLLALAIVFQVVGRNAPVQINQFLVGPLINAILLVATFTCGIWWAVAIGVLTPLTAWILGQLMQPLAPVIPFIMVANALFIIGFGIFRNYKRYGVYIGAILGSILKFSFLYISALKLVSLFKISLPKPIMKNLIIIFGIPQLITALIGSCFAVIIIGVMKKRKILLD